MDKQKSNEPNEARPYSVNSFERKLIIFQDYVNQITLKESEETAEERRQKILETLRFDQFCDKIRQLFGEDVKGSHLKNVFKKICSNPDANVDWSEIFGYESTVNSSHQNTSNEFTDTPPQNDINTSEVQVFMTSFKFRIGDASGDKARRDILQSIFYASDIDCFITASQKGAISVWNNKLKLQACASLNDQTDGWTSCCCYLANLKKVVITSERNFTIWDFRSKSKAKTKSSVNLLSIQPISEPLTCIDCATDINRTDKDVDRIIFGDESGNVMLLILNINDLAASNSKVDPHNDQRRILQFQQFKKAFIKRKIHDESVLKIKYIPELQSFISCSRSSKVSLIIEEMEKFETKETRTYRSLSVNRGINTFCYCSKAHLIATGGVDKIIRLYNPLVLNKPTGKLLGHLFTIIDIVCNEKDQQLISLSSERVFRVWDISTLKCLQMFSDTEERPGEKRIYCICFDERRERLLTGSSVFDAWPLTRSIQDTMQIPHSHERPLVAVAYNSYINQIATVCSESTLKVWEADTGHLMYSVPELHGKNVEVTSMSLDSSGYRLATGAMDGSLKVWDFSAGQQLKQKPGRKSTTEDMSIVNLIYTKMNDELYIIAFGWNNKIKLFHDTNESNDLTLLKSFNDQIQITDELSFLSRTISLSRPNSKPLLSSMHTTMSSRNSQNGSRQLNGTSQSVYDHRSSSTLKKDHFPLLLYHEVKTACYNSDAHLLVSGGLHGEFVLWDKKQRCVEKICPFPQDYNPSAAVKRGLLEGHSVTPESAEHLRKINCLKIIVHRNRKTEVILETAEPIVTPSSRPNSPKPDGDTNIAQNKNGDESANQLTLPPLVRQTSSSASSTSDAGINLLVPDTANESKKSKAVTRVVDMSYPAIIVTGHDDSSIRLWTSDGVLMNEIIPPAGSITGAACSAICADQNGSHLYTADTRGYVTMWYIADFIQNFEASQHSPESIEQNKNSINMLVCWKAHTNKIVDMLFVSANKALLTASLDESVRIWWGSRGRFIGFLGQLKPITIPMDDLSDWAPPYDISEPPMYATTKAPTDKKTFNSNYEYPLVLDKTKFNQPIQKRTPLFDVPEPSFLSEESFQNKKFFNALTKPKHVVNTTEVIAASPRKDGAIYASLPLYREKKSDEFDLKLMLMSNPYRKNRELSHLTLHRISVRKKETEKLNAKLHPHHTVPAYNKIPSNLNSSSLNNIQPNRVTTTTNTTRKFIK